MSYERLKIADHVDKWSVDKVKHVEDGIIANEEAIKSLANKGQAANWNQNDPSKPGYIENRPFYEEDAKEILILAETEVETEAKYGSNIPWADLSLGLVETEEGDIFKVILDGQSYYALAKDLVEGENNLHLGNLSFAYSFLKNNEYYPFAVQLGTNLGYGSGTIYTLEPGAHTVSIYKIDRAVKKIDKQFIGETGAFQSNGKIRKERFSYSGILQTEFQSNQSDAPSGLFICYGSGPVGDIVFFYKGKKYYVKTNEKFLLDNSIEAYIVYYSDYSSSRDNWILVVDPKHYDEIKGNYFEISIITEEYDRIPLCCVELPCGVPTEGEIQVEGELPVPENINGVNQMILWSGYDFPIQQNANYTTDAYPPIIVGNFSLPNSYIKNLYFIGNKSFEIDNIDVWIEYKSGQYGAPGEVYLKSHSDLGRFVSNRYSLRAAGGDIRKLDPMFLPDSVIISDWNADAGENGYIANRTHYTTYHYNTEIDTKYFGEMEIGPGYYYYKLPYSDLSAGRFIMENGRHFLFTVDVPFYINNQAYTVHREPNGDLLLITYSLTPLNCRMTLYKGIETGVKQLDAKYLPKAAAVSNASDTVTPEQFNALLTALRNAGYLAE